MPTRPPYTAHLGNLAYDVTSTDIEGFLGGCEVTNVRIVEDKLDRKPKGFGYVEFGTLDGLKKALTLTESSFMGRNIKISVAEPRESDHERTENAQDTSMLTYTSQRTRRVIPRPLRLVTQRAVARNASGCTTAVARLQPWI